MQSGRQEPLPGAMLDDMQTLLEFYAALGIERVPFVSSAHKSGRKLSGGNEKETLLAALRDDIGECLRCPLSAGRNTIVFGVGDPCSRIMFIGEAPGREEDIQGIPFVGDAGKLLTRMIEKMGFSRDTVYIANIVKCRPPGNRDPEEIEINTCREFLDRQIDIIQPEVIMALGRIALKTLKGTATAKITAERGAFFSYKNVPVMPTYHPAYLLRNPAEKWNAWSDAQKVLDFLDKKT